MVFNAQNIYFSRYIYLKKCRLLDDKYRIKFKQNFTFVYIKVFFYLKFIETKTKSERAI